MHTEATSDRDSPSTKQLLISHALDMAETTSLADFTLRPLAQSAGVSVATLNHHFGQKAAILEALVEVAIEREASFASVWSDRLAHLPIRSSRARAPIARAVFDNWLAANRREILVILDCLQSPNVAAPAHAALMDWSTKMGAFWSRVFFGTDRFGELALGYAIDEAAFTLGAPDQPLFPALRALCLERLVTCRSGEPAADPDLFPALVSALEPGSLPGSIRDLKPQARKIVASVSEMLKAPDPEPITHRAVAAKCDVSPATVVYQFGATEDLIIAGLYALIENFHASRSRPEEASSTPLADLVRATGLIALKAARIPELSQHALDMRRRRGENITAQALIGAGFPDHLAKEPLFRQVIALCIFGTRRLAYALGGADDEQAIEIVLAWIRAPREIVR